MVVTAKEHGQVRCRVTGAGIIRSRQGINLPGAKLSVASLTEADMVNAIWAARNEVDFVSLSFVRKAVDVLLLKELLKNVIQDEARHVSYGTMHLKYFLEHHPQREQAIADMHQLAEVAELGMPRPGFCEEQLAALADELARLNGIEDPKALRAGQVLRLR